MTADKAAPPAVGAVPQGEFTDLLMHLKAIQDGPLKPYATLIRTALTERDARIAELEQDVVRYRWLRDDVDLESVFDEIPNGDGFAFKQGAELDAAIDALLSGEG